MPEFAVIIVIVLAVLALLAFFLLKKLVRVFWNYPSTIPLIAANLVPAVGVLFWEWSAFPVFFLYWLESVVFVFFMMLRIAKTAAPEKRLSDIVSWSIVAFIFLGTQLHVILWLFSRYPRYWWYPSEICTVVDSGVWTCTPYTGLVRSLSPEIWAGLLVFLISHGFSHIQNFLKKQEFLKVTDEKQYIKEFFTRMFGPLLILAFGAASVATSGNYMPALVLFILVKTLVDARMHIKKHKRLAEIPQAAS